VDGFFLFKNRLSVSVIGFKNGKYKMIVKLKMNCLGRGLVGEFWISHFFRF
jgi:hypothetical protein